MGGVEETFQRHLDPFRKEISEIRYELACIEKDIKKNQDKLDQLIKTENEDVLANANKISFIEKQFEKLKGQVNKIQEKIKILHVQRA